MLTPFFSILLPTRNRSLIVGEAIDSVLNQSFGDFELVVSDNDDREGKTRNVVQGRADPRLRYFRTSGNLPMHENWEFARLQATGRYIFVLEDKTRLVQNALDVLFRILNKFPEAVISFPFIVSATDVLEPSRELQSPRVVPSRMILDRFTQFDDRVNPMLPRGLNSVAPRNLLEKIASRSPTGQVFSFLAPDYSQCFQVLSCIQSVLYLPSRIVYSPLSLKKRGSFSNGGSLLVKGEMAGRWFAQLPVPEHEIVREAPVPSQWLWINILMFDFQKFVRIEGYTPRWNWVRYHGYCLFLIALGTSWGGNMRSEVRMVGVSLLRRGFWFTLRVFADFLSRCLGAVWKRLAGNREL